MEEELLVAAPKEVMVATSTERTEVGAIINEKVRVR
jgi:hypothetical protein